MLAVENCFDCSYGKNEYCRKAKRKIDTNRYELGLIPDWCPLIKE